MKDEDVRNIVEHNNSLQLEVWSLKSKLKKANETLRDQFAMAALSCIPWERFDRKCLAIEAYNIADEMLKAREE